jgi:integration host factor subunit alpha
VNKNNFTKQEIIINLSNKTGFSINFSKKLVNDLLVIFIKKIKSGELNLKNLGSFKLLSKNERLGRNPKTKKEFIINSRKSIKFTTSKKLANFLNKIND